MSTLFRFVTVRAPRTPSEDDLLTGFVEYSAAIEAPLVHNVATVLRKPEGRQQALRLLGAFQRTAAFLTEPRALATLDAPLAKWAAWLAANAHRLDPAMLAAFRAANPPQFDPNSERVIWDNVLAHSQIGGRAELRASLQWALRVLHLLRRSADAPPDAPVLQRIANATVLLPASTRLPPEERPRTDPPPPPVPTPDGMARLTAIQAAIDDVSRVLRDDVARARAEPPVPVRVPHADACPRELPPAAPDPGERAVRAGRKLIGFDERFEARLREPTRVLLRELGITVGTQVTHVLAELQRAAGEHAGRMVKPRGAELPVMHAGGSFWTRATPREPHGHDGPPPADDKDKPSDCKVTSVGVADFRRVEQRICCYEPGEVAHIENVMRGEAKERITRHLTRTEETVSTSTEEETTKERDTQTTDRFEVERETSKVVNEDLAFDIGVQVAADFGMVKLQADTKFAMSSSKVESDRAASNYARQVTERALERVMKRVKEERTTVRLDEFEETNKHTLASSTTEHTVGLYRWVDKIYEAKVVNYGKRMMFEFLVPEPAAFHLHAKAEAPAETGLTIARPIDPRSPELQTELGLKPLVSHDDITEVNYSLYAAAYGAKVDPPPPVLVTTSKAYALTGLDASKQFADAKTDLKVPTDYEALFCVVPYGMHHDEHDDNWITLIVGQHQEFSRQGGTMFDVLNGEDDIIPIAIMGRSTFYACTVEAICMRTPTALATWAIKTFNTILAAYQDKLAAFESALAQAKAKVGVLIEGSNPLRNRVIERTELQKGCIRLFAQCKPIASEAMKDHQDCDYPEFDCCEAIEDGSYVQFMEQVFEWRLMTYLFYPYFWGRKCNWKQIYQIDDADPVFLGFLQAGYARVLVPVREGYDAAALHFLADQTLWDGHGTPGVDDPLYVSMINEMKEPVGEVDPDIEPWPVVVPTALTVLQCESGCVDGKGLPCPCEDEADA